MTLCELIAKVFSRKETSDSFSLWIIPETVVGRKYTDENELRKDIGDYIATLEAAGREIATESKTSYGNVAIVHQVKSEKGEEVMTYHALTQRDEQGDYVLRKGILTYEARNMDTQKAARIAQEAVRHGVIVAGVDNNTYMVFMNVHGKEQQYAGEILKILGIENERVCTHKPQRKEMGNWVYMDERHIRAA